MKLSISAICLLFFLSCANQNTVERKIKDYLNISANVNISDERMYKNLSNPSYLYPSSIFIYFKADYANYKDIVDSYHLLTKEELELDSVTNRKYNIFFKNSLWSMIPSYLINSDNLDKVNEEIPWWKPQNCFSMHIGLIDEKTKKIADFKENHKFNGRLISCFCDSKCYFLFEYLVPPK